MSDSDAKPSHRLYLQVLLAIAIGVALGHFFPRAGEACKPLGDIFIRLIKMVIAGILSLDGGGRKVYLADIEV